MAARKIYSSGVLVFMLFAELILGLVDPADAAQSNNSKLAQAQSAVQVAPTDCQTSKGFSLTVANQSLLNQLQSAAGTNAVIACHDYTGKVRFLSTDVGKPLVRSALLAANASPEDATRKFLADYGPLFGLTDQARELNVMQNVVSDQGHNFIRYQQVYRGIPVIAGEIIVQVDQNQQVVSAGGELLPDPNLSVVPQLNADQARYQAFSKVAKTYKIDQAGLTSTSPELAIYDTRLLADYNQGFSQLVWKMVVESSGVVAGSEPFKEFVLVDANTGLISLSFNQIEEAKNRRVCNNNNFPVNQEADCTSPVRVEGQVQNGVDDVNKAYDYSGITYDFYKNNFNRDSLDGKGLTLKSTVKFCYAGYSCPYANAFWNGTQMYYGQGYAVGDDVVGHELTHGFTQYTSGLYYSFDSGAINESMSDIFGEFIDQTDGSDGCAGNAASQNWLLGEDLPIGGSCNGQIRSMKNPPAYQDPDKTSSPYYYPGRDDHAGVHTNSGISNKAAYLIAAGTSGEPGGTFNGQTITGIGIPKASQIYYELETHILTSGANYRELYNYLQLACTNLIGRFSITSTDCQQVTKAVTATEMNMIPPGSPTDAQICSSTGQIPSNLFFDNMENPVSGNWTSQVTVGGTNPWSNSTAKPYSGSRSLYGKDLGTTSDSNIRMNNSVTLPANAYMYFRHYYQFDYDSYYNYDGGVVEYSTNGGSTWNDASALFDANGYNDYIVYYNGGDNPLANRYAFTFLSRSYFSSRLDLSSLAGSSIRFRFRIGTDSSLGDVGWFIDDVRIYTCALPVTSTTLTSTANPTYSGKPVTFNATITTDGPVPPTGNVTFLDNGTPFGTVSLNGNIATFSTSSLSVGSHPITAVYSGDGNNSTSSSNTVYEQINLATTTTSLTSSLNPSYSAQPITFKANVTGPGVAPTGSVTFYDNGSQLGAPVAVGNNGIATYTTSSISIATHPITAVYSGDANNIGSTSGVVNQQVVIAPTTVALVTSASPVFSGQSVTFKAWVTNTWGGVPTGTVTFREGVTDLATVSLSGGSATYNTSSLSNNIHLITAIYNGDSNNSGSTSNTVTQQILASGCTSLQVTTAVDDGSCGSLRQALAVAHDHAVTSGSRIVEISTALTAPVKLDGADGGVTLGLGITLQRQDGGCTVNGPDKNIQAGTASTGDGLTLNNATLIGVWASGFTGRQIVAFGGQKFNTLTCVRATKDNPA